MRRRQYYTGSIPACAGEPTGPYRPHRPPTVYPRVCGGTVSASSLAGVTTGLSPRVRGNLCSPHLPNGVTRSIPACAGEPPRTRNCQMVSMVYPRVCGGTNPILTITSMARGLSPRVRGNHAGSTDGAGGPRSIPACAGEPPTGVTLEDTAPVYPRVCGGTWIALQKLSRASGLSPRVRGNLGKGGLHVSTLRSIPACAGEPPEDRQISATTAVYPRVCGGTSRAMASSIPRAGLSPRVRGNHDYCAPFIRCRRSIPACAGEPPRPR